MSKTLTKSNTSFFPVSENDTVVAWIKSGAKYFAPGFFLSLALTPFIAFLFCPDCFWNPEQNNIHVLRYYGYTFFIFYELARFFSRRLNRFYDWQTQTRQMLWANSRMFLLVVLPFTIAYTYIRFRIVSDTPEVFDNRHIYGLFRNNILLYLLFSTVLNAKDFFNSWKESIQRNKELERQRLAYQLKALKNQINPHFLFNNLNTLSQIVKEDSELAEDFIDQLSKVYRYLLQQKDNDLVTVEEELKFLDSFLFLIKIRFKDQTIIEMDTSTCTGFYVAPIVLQLVLENAIKHNIASREQPLHISIKREGDFIEVKNNFNPKASISYSSGIGLQNIQERYSLLTDVPVEVEENVEEFIVRIPLIFEIPKTLV